MSKNLEPKHDHKHLTLSDRIYIEQELIQGSSFKSIAKTLKKDPTTIAKEVQSLWKIPHLHRNGALPQFVHSPICYALHI